jgi:hypothetical protein
MEPRSLARQVALGRSVLAAALLALPARAGGGWVGPDAGSPGGRVLAEGLGARDLALGLGTLRALSRNEALGTWFLASALADLADCIATVRARDSIPTPAAIGVTALAGTGALLSLWLARELG